ncbi:MAG: hypothetical protein COT84_07635 [Chlamydiae bacterium CG10_big_fil_rev_8_21_14_0_10_35_9]|nr:MAG: hypothetical protein COT84_07635 [Chlamydiae bacterium CG10_big_fil_rev_8_21_14_0_10_35_9]
MFAFKEQGNPRKQPLVFLHGFLGNKDDFDDTIQYLLNDFFCISIDLPGHGFTPFTSAPDSFDYICQQIQVFIQNLENPIFIGYSMGGRIAHVFQQATQQKYKAIVMGSHFGLSCHEQIQERCTQEKNICRQLETLSFSDFINNWYKNPLFTPFRKHPKFTTTVQRRLHNNPDNMLLALKAFSLTKQPVYKPSSSLTIIAGEKDEKYCRYYESLNIKFIKIPDAGHAIHIEEPKHLAQTIKEVLHVTVSLD